MGLTMPLRRRAELLARQDIDPARWRAALLREVSARAGPLRAFAHWRPDDFADPRIPTRPAVSYKDNIAVAGHPTGFGLSSGYREWPAESAEIVRRLSAIDCVSVGKTAMTELSVGTQIPCPNPAYPHVSAGGSSTGAAVATVAGLCDMGIGTDSGGSIRWPAVYCGAVSLRLSYDEALLRGVWPVAPSMESIGLVARSCADLEHLWFREGVRAVSCPQAPAAAGLGSTAFGLVTECLDGSVQPEIASAVLRLADALLDGGHAVTPVAVSWWRDRDAAWDLLSHEAYLTNRDRWAGHCHQATERVLARGYAVGGPRYARCLSARQGAAAAASDEFAATACQVWMLPLDPHLADRPPAPDRPSTLPAPRAGNDKLGFTIAASLAGIPVVAMPIGEASDGSPIGLQLWAPHGGEDTLVRAANLIDATISACAHTAS
jgi:aspartyl-tRNA(Asn)/glutamyl-tRNA(Gln) amidotransferase subunit A